MRLLIIIALLFSVSATQANTSVLREASAKYLPEQSYEVYRNGESVGFYRLNFSYPAASELKVEVEMQLSLKIFGLFSYQYKYDAAEYWTADQLVQLDVEIDKNGDIEQLSAQRAGGRLMMQDSKGKIAEIDGKLLTTHHWYSEILNQSEVLNTLTGKPSKIDVKSEQTARWSVAGQKIEVEGFRLGGDLKDTLSWYDSQGIWRGMEFLARDGSTIVVRWTDTEVLDEAAS